MPTKKSKTPTKSSPKKNTKAKCNDVKPKPLAMFNDNKRDRISEMRERCTAQGKMIHKKCKVPHTKQLVCHDSDRN